MRISLYLLIITFASIIFSNCADYYDNDSGTGDLLKKRYLNGKLQSEILYDDSDKPLKLKSYNTDGEFVSYISYEYNDKGNAIKLNYFNADDELTGYTEKFYDQEDRMITQKFYVKENSTFELNTTYDYEYNALNQPVKVTKISSTNFNYYIENVFDNKDNRIEEKYNFYDSGYVGSLYFEYDNNLHPYTGYWNKLHTIHPFSKHNIVAVTSNLEEEEGVVYISNGMMSIGYPLYTASYSYNKKGQVISETLKQNKGDIDETTYEYY